MPLELKDVELAARQAVLVYVLEKTAVDEDFAKRLRSTTARVRELLEARRRQQKLAEKEGIDASVVFPGTPPDEAIARLHQAQKVAPRDPLVAHNLAVAYLYRAQSRYRAGEVELAREDWLVARRHAAVCAKSAPGDTRMIAIGEQVDRMGRRWGFAR